MGSYKDIFVYQINKKEELSLSDRIYYCECGNRMERDANAAVNIMNEGKRIFAECA